MAETGVFQALLITTLAGLSTAIGSVLGLYSRRPSTAFIGFSLGFSAGVMVLVAFGELLPTAVAVPALGFAGAYSAFFAGMMTYFLIDLAIPHEYIGQHDHSLAVPGNAGTHSLEGLERTGLLVMLGITIHNFPEGMATFIAAMEDLRVGVALGIAIAIHNIPEGLAISAPVYLASGSRKKAFLWSFFSGISEIAGALLAAALLAPFLSETVMGIALGCVAGIMVAISLDELIPVAKTLDSEHGPILGVITGMMVMAISLYLLK
ncbi:MAG: zinc transporter ZupT [Deltaproteobacteria bacterium]|nr:zinc transporter ZupT [Deltaproteobacteria bacterium]MDX9761971.1 zinc transporter ZupT [Desulfomonilia bacterium]HPW68516.1 zinc transporter ZupT [Deltaproteobacteria bacterium]